MDHSYDRTELPSPLILGSTTTTRQYGSGYYLRNTTTSTVSANGTNTQTYSYVDDSGHTYSRNVAAKNSSILYDTIAGSLSESWEWPWNRGGVSGLKKGSQGTNDGYVGRLVDGRGDGKLKVW